MSIKKQMIINLDECTGCNLCQIACKDEHVGNAYPPWTEPQPDTGQFWIKVHALERGQTPKVKVTYMPQICVHCENAPCIKACPEDAIRRREDGLVWIDPANCTGCRLCEEACPYDVIYFNEGLNVAQKCTGCAHRVDQGLAPRCADVCPRDAIVFGDESEPEMKRLTKAAEALHPEFATRPRVLYVGLPRPFVAGRVVDASTRDAIQGARVTAVDLFNDERRTVLTDGFGDFELKELGTGHKYLIQNEKEGYLSSTVMASTDRDLNLGEIRLVGTRGKTAGGPGRGKGGK